MRFSLRCLLTLACSTCTLFALAQPKLEFNLKKPEQFQERKLGSEKMADKKFTFTRKVFQSGFTRFNYYFNANEKIKAVVAAATEVNDDDFNELLRYYPFSLEHTAQSTEIDSILQTATAGILLHDLRNSYIDNLYLVLGKAYLLRKDYDSAAMAFQYINTSYAPKEKDGYDQPIGSNSVEGSNAFTIATKEKTGITNKVLSHPPSRNESFLWLIRTQTERGDVLDAASLITTLRNDPNFPERLRTELDDAQGYMFYKLETWDSAATYLEKSIDLRQGAEARSRAWYLTGQLYQLAGQSKKASEAFARCSKTAVDPVMDIYARLNSIRLRKGEDPAVIDQNIAELLSMAKKDRYYNYRDMIYYAAGLFEMERNGFEAADGHLQKSLKTNFDNPDQRSMSHKLLGDVRYAAKKYGNAALPYDSANTASLRRIDSVQVEQRRPGTKAVFIADQVIQIQDSLLKIAALPDAERNQAVRTVSRQLRKARGLKEEAANTGSVGAISQAAASSQDLFTGGGGPWYFYDVNRRTNGKERFLEQWGDRPNVDNWRRSAGISLAASASVRNTGPGTEAPSEPAAADVVDVEERFDTADISFDNLYSRLPISEEKKLRANNRITQALYGKARALHEKIEDYPEAIKYYEMVLERQDTGRLAAQSLFALVHCYTKTGDTELANKARKVLAQRFSGDSLAAKANGQMMAKGPEANANPAATRDYQKVYDLFISGDFAAAEKAKKQADAQYGNTYWTPQLTYIETVYYLKERNDSMAMKKLDDLIAQFPDHALAARAKLLKELLPKRLEIESYLAQLQVERLPDDVPVTLPNANVPKPVNKPRDPVNNPPPKEAPKVVAIAPDPKPAVEAKPTAPDSPYPINAKGPQVVAMVLENIDPAYVNETIYSLNNSGAKLQYNGQAVEVEKLKLRDKLFLAVLRSAGFTNADNAFEYIDYLKPVAAKEIISWLDSKKYRFIILSEENLQKLKGEPKLEDYEKILKQTFPTEF